MAKELVVAGETYNYPENRDTPGWGEEGFAWAEAVTSVLSTVSGVGDILLTSASLLNNQAIAANINGFSFDPVAVRSAICEFSIYRVTSLEERVEQGTLYLGYKSVAGTWELTAVGSGLSGVVITITPAGQLQYTSDLLAGTGHSGVIKFRARALTI